MGFSCPGCDAVNKWHDDGNVSICNECGYVVTKAQMDTDKEAD